VTFKVRRLEPDDDRSTFRSGNVDLDRFFLRYAGQNQFRHHIGTTYVAVDAAGEIAGFATVTASEIAPQAMEPSKRKRCRSIQSRYFDWLASPSMKHAKGKGMGSLLIRSVLVLAQQMADDMDCVGVLVDAKPDAVPFYEKLGFVTLDSVAGESGDRPAQVPMFLEIGQVPQP
jgi:GNAT superfamily N-acetyltransferase